MNPEIPAALRAAIIAAAVLLSSCASTHGAQIEALRAEVAQAQAAAEKAQATADAAMAAAREANACCADSTERLDRAFRKIQQK